ncbi:hypothetical protein ACFL4F_02245 [Candidatus Margulisiibacteriota bacterium]
MSLTVDMGVNLILGANPASAAKVSSKEDAKPTQKVMKFAKQAEKNIIDVSDRLKKMASEKHPEKIKEINGSRDQALALIRRISREHPDDHEAMKHIAALYEYISEEAYPGSNPEDLERLFSVFKDANGKIPGIERGSKRITLIQMDGGPRTTIFAVQLESRLGSFGNEIKSNQKAEKNAAKNERRAKKAINALSDRLRKMTHAVYGSRLGDSDELPNRIKQIDDLQKQALNAVERKPGENVIAVHELLLMTEIYEYLSGDAITGEGYMARDQLLFLFKDANARAERLDPLSHRYLHSYLKDLKKTVNYKKEAEDNIDHMTGKMREKATRSRKPPYDHPCYDQSTHMADMLRGQSREVIMRMFVAHPTDWMAMKRCAEMYKFISRNDVAGWGPDTFKQLQSWAMIVNNTISSRIKEHDRSAHLDDVLDIMKNYYSSVKTFHDKHNIKICSLYEATSEELASVSWKVNGEDPFDYDFKLLDIGKITKAVEDVIGRYPEKILKQMFPSRIICAKGFGGLVGRNFLVADVEDEGTLDHELFHWFDVKLDLKMLSARHNEWVRITGSSYVGWGVKIDGWRECRGFAREYGLRNSNEDKATVAEMLFTQKTEYLRNRLMFDPKLLMKVELITGSKYDARAGKFTKMYTRDELMKEYGMDGHLYFGRWSRYRGKVQMDADYWNNIVNSNKGVPRYRTARKLSS